MEKGVPGTEDTPCPWVAGDRYVPIHFFMRSRGHLGGPGARKKVPTET